MKPLRTRAWSLAALIATTLLASRADAQPVARGFTANKFEPSERGSDWFSAESLDLRGTVRPAVGIVGDYTSLPLVSRSPDGEIDQRVVHNMFTFHAGAAVNLLGRLRLSISAPLVASNDGSTRTVGGSIYNAPAGGGIGDIRLGADVRLAGYYGDAVTVATGVRLWAPAGDEASYTGEGSWRIGQVLNFAGEAGIFTWALHAGYLYKDRSQLFDGAPIGGSGMRFGAAAGLKLVDKRLVVGPEIVGSTLFDDPFGKAVTPVEGLLGAHFSIFGGLRGGAAVGTGLAKGIGAPAARVLFSIEWMLPAAPDRDGDGIRNEEDACPDVVGVHSADPEKNGCPEPRPEDKDGDGVLDKEDACVDVAGVKTNDPKTNGCPPDGDHDGVYDKDDACIAVAGVRTNDPKTNGCPPDGDGDGIIDAEDACPTEAGLKTNDPKTNGCPDQDIDKDGVLNADDACPDQPGQPDPDPKKNGCPKAYIQADQIKIVDQVKFKTGSAQILPGKDSEEILLAVAQVLTAHPEVKKVRIEGHTDDRGPLALNMRLSGERAASVVKWLADHGVGKEKLESKGFGPEHPISTNKTEAGRKDNRRVEFHIEKTPAP